MTFFYIYISKFNFTPCRLHPTSNGNSISESHREERVREIEHGSFTPLVFSTSGGMGPTTTTAYKRLAALISEKHNQQYSTTLHWMRCRLSLSLIRSAIMCLRGARSTYHHPTFSGDSMDVACSEGRIFTQD